MVVGSFGLAGSVLVHRTVAYGSFHFSTLGLSSRPVLRCSCAAYPLLWNPNVKIVPSGPVAYKRLGKDPAAVQVPHACPRGCYGSFVPARAFGCGMLCYARGANVCPRMTLIRAKLCSPRMTIAGACSPRSVSSAMGAGASRCL